MKKILQIFTITTLLLIGVLIPLVASSQVSAAAAKCFVPSDSGGLVPFDCNILNTVDPATFAQITAQAQASATDICFKLKASNVGVGGPAEVIQCDQATNPNQTPPECFKGEYIHTDQGDIHVFRNDYCTDEYKQKLGKDFQTTKCYLLEYDKSFQVTYHDETTCTTIKKQVQDDAGKTGTVVTNGGGNPGGGGSDSAGSGSFQGGTPADSLTVDCDLKGGEFFGIPTWYKYLKGKQDAFGKCTPVLNNCQGVGKDANGKDLCTNYQGFLAIGLAILDMLLRVAGLVAVAFIIYAGFMYITSQGEPDATTKAKDAIINAVVGLGIVIVASIVVAFIGSKLQ